MTKNNSTNEFDAQSFFAIVRPGVRRISLEPKQLLFMQGDTARFVFYLQSGRVKLSVVSKSGKEHTISFVEAGDFLGEESISKPNQCRIATATAAGHCVAMRIDRSEMVNLLETDFSLSGFFIATMLAKSLRTQAALVDQLFNSAEKRLAQLLVWMADFENPAEPDSDGLIPPISQETLAGMVGTTRSRVSYFMNRFRESGFIEYSGRIRVHRTLQEALLTDSLQKRSDLRSLELVPEREPIISSGIQLVVSKSAHKSALMQCETPVNTRVEGLERRTSNAGHSHTPSDRRR